MHSLNNLAFIVVKKLTTLKFPQPNGSRINEKQLTCPDTLDTDLHKNSSPETDSPFLWLGLLDCEVEVLGSTEPGFISRLLFWEFSSMGSAFGLAVPSAVGSSLNCADGKASSSASVFTSVLISSLTVDGSISILTPMEETGVMEVVAVAVEAAMAWAMEVGGAEVVFMLFIPEESDARRLDRCTLFSTTGSTFGFRSPLLVPLRPWSLCESKALILYIHQERGCKRITSTKGYVTNKQKQLNIALSEKSFIFHNIWQHACQCFSIT